MTVDLIKYSALDSDVIWAARVSTAGEQSAAELNKNPEQSQGLISYLMRNRHGTPFEHSSMTFLVAAPIFVIRHFQRHRAGWSYNEESARYRELAPVFYLPSPDRKMVQTGRPGRYQFDDGTSDQRRLAEAAMRDAYLHSYRMYRQMLSHGISRELARSVLPVGIYSSMYATCNARSLMHFLSLRTTHESASVPSYPQREIEMVAEQMEKLWAKLMPLTHEAFNFYGRRAP